MHISAGMLPREVTCRIMKHSEAGVGLWSSECAEVGFRREEQALAELPQHGPGMGWHAVSSQASGLGGAVESSADAINSKGKNLVRENNYILFLDLYLYT